MQTTRRFSTYDIVIVGVMAALCFAATAFFKIGPIPTPAGPTMLKTGNVICLLGGLLFGGVRGGLAAGIGSALYDLSDPIFAPSAPFTLFFFFLMAFICGTIAHWGAHRGESRNRNLIAAIAGAGSYLILHLGKTIITLVLAGSTVQAALGTASVKLVTSGFNAVFAVAVAVIIAPICRNALIRAKILNR